MTTQKPNRRKSREAALQILFCNSFSDRELMTSVAAVQSVQTTEDLQLAIDAAREARAAADGVVRTLEHAIESLQMCVREGGKAQLKPSPETLTGNVLHLATTRREAIQQLRKSAQALETSDALYDDKGFALRLVREFERHSETIDNAIQRALTGWNLRRLTAEDRAMLRLGATELMYFLDVPQAVIIDQYLEISKDYGDKESSKLLNAVLDRINKDHPRTTPEPAEKSE